ncbi:putative 2OG-Fe(II) oxygenase [Pseudohongiella acticola]|nr:putative 2OG-Fe(II) oxygenase [Pseudohongiella acticola]
MEHQMMNMFAVPLYRGALGRDFTAEEMQFFKAELSEPVQAISNYASANKKVLDAAAMKSIRAALQAHLEQYFKITFNTSNNVSLQITQSWLTRSQKGDAHHTHTHPNSVVSGVLYINLAPTDGINFYRNDDNVWYELLRQQDTYYNASRYFVQTGMGDIILFPSNVRHGVSEVTEQVDRVSLSFNTFFSGEIGREEFSNQLNIRLT